MVAPVIMYAKYVTIHEMTYSFTATLLLTTVNFKLRLASSLTILMPLVLFLCSQDCGYVFTKGPKAWAALPDNYSCPPCGAPKRRFKKVPKGSASGKVEVKKSWF
jgi:rubredoxin